MSLKNKFNFRGPWTCKCRGWTCRCVKNMVSQYGKRVTHVHGRKMWWWKAASNGTSIPATDGEWKNLRPLKNRKRFSPSPVYLSKWIILNNTALKAEGKGNRKSKRFRCLQSFTHPFHQMKQKRIRCNEQTVRKEESKTADNVTAVTTTVDLWRL